MKCISQKKVSFRGFWYAFVTVLLLAVGMGLLGVQSAHAETKQVRVKYLSNSGKTNSSLEALNQTVAYGTKIKLAVPPVVNNYKALGWSKTKAAATAEFSPGTIVTLKNNVTLYAVYKRYPCAVKFNNFNGTSSSTAYSSLNCYVAKNYFYTLPDLPKVKGYTAVGWSTVKGNASKIYKPGSKYKVTGNITFYAVFKKNVYCTVSFYSMEGLTNARYKALEVKVLQNSCITLPNVPGRTGYVNLGWSNVKNASSIGWAQGKKVKITQNCKVYAVQRVGVNVILHDYSGGIYRTAIVEVGGYFRFPTVSNPEKYTFMGWSSAKGVTIPASGYNLPGSQIKVTKKAEFYPIRYEKALEKDLSESQMYTLDTKKYSKVIFIGDSRTNREMRALVTQFGSDSVVLKNMAFIPGEGMGLSWLKETAYPGLVSMLKQGYHGTSSKPTAVVIRLGVNDLRCTSMQSNIADQYLSYLKKLSSVLKSYHCRLFVESVNPVNSKMTVKVGKVARNEKDVLDFNKKIKTGLAGSDCTYIDTFSWLVKYGYSFDKGYGVDTGIDDGLHYSTKTYKRIHNYCVNKINLL